MAAQYNNILFNPMSFLLFQCPQNINTYEWLFVSDRLYHQTRIENRNHFSLHLFSQNDNSVGLCIHWLKEVYFVQTSNTLSLQLSFTTVSIPVNYCIEFLFVNECDDTRKTPRSSIRVLS